MDKVFYTIDEAAHRLGVSEDAFRNMAARAHLWEFGASGMLLFARNQVDELAGRTDVAGDDPRAVPPGGGFLSTGTVAPDPVADGLKQPYNSTIRVAHTATGMTLTKRPSGYQGIALSRLLKGLFVGGIVSPFTVIMIIAAIHHQLAWHGLALLFVAPFWAVAIAEWVAAYNRAHGSAVFEVTGDILRVTYASPLHSRECQWQRDQLNTINCGISKWEQIEWGIPEYQLQVHLVEGRMVGFLTGGDEEELTWLAAMLRRALRSDRANPSIRPPSRLLEPRRQSKILNPKKWWQASLAVILFFVVFAAAAVGWHRYIATSLPLAAFMRSIYLDTNRFGNLMNFAFFDAFFPQMILGAGIGWIGRRQGKFFAVFHGLWVAMGSTAILPLYTHWLHPSPTPNDWPLYPWGWEFLIKTLLPGANLVIIPAVTLAAQHAFSPDYKEKTRTTTSDEDRIRAAMVERFGDRFANYQPKENRADAAAPSEPYTVRQIWAMIRLMRVRGWSVDRAAKRFKIPADELRGCMRAPPPKCTAEELSAIAEVAQERGWTAEEAAKRLEVPEEPLREHMRELG